MNKKTLLSLSVAVATLFSAKAAEASKGSSSSAKSKTTATVVSQTKTLQQKLTEARTEYDALLKKFQQERADFITALKAHLLAEEGYVAHPYLDINGLIHTGCGININNKKIFMSLPFQKEDGTLLTQGEKEDYYKKLSDMGPEQKNLSMREKHSANYYKQFAPYTLTKEKNDELLDEKIDEAIMLWENKLGAVGFNDMALSAKVATTEMPFMRKAIVEEATKFHAAFKKNDYDKMAKESTFKNGGTRNDRRQALFIKAKTEERPHTAAKLSLSEAKLNYYLQQAGQEPVKSAFSTGNPVKVTPNPTTQNATTQKANAQKLASARGR